MVKVLKVRKSFTYQDVPLRLVDSEEHYMNGREPMVMQRVVAPNGFAIPVNFQHRQTLKSMIEQTISFLDSVSSRGYDVVKELTKEV